MKLITKFSLGIASAFILASCSSGGSGSSNSNSTVTPIPDGPTNPTNPEQNPTTAETGQYLKITLADNNVINSTSGSINSNDLEQLTIDDKSISISQPGIYAGKWTKYGSNSSSTSTCCGETDHSKIGYSDNFAMNGGDSMTYMFFYGNPTPEMPNSGVADYNGQFLYDSMNNETGNEIYGTANYKADFVNKTFEGELKADNVTIDIQADIDNNGLSGTANSSLDSSVGTVTGKFYGPDAAEVAGMVEGTKDGNLEWAGVFNGKK